MARCLPGEYELSRSRIWTTKAPIDKQEYAIPEALKAVTDSQVERRASYR